MKTVQQFDKIDKGKIFSLEWDTKAKELFVGTSQGGVYVFNF
jgi:hypothetical protein